jgi:pimeloyl-ACP methyl ester carboxylesterase
MATPSEGFVPVNGALLHYLNWGGPRERPLVLIHGLTGFAHTWDDWAARWSKDFWVLAYDQRGHGESEHVKPGGYEGYNTKQLANDLQGFASALGLDQFDVLGHSLGGRTVIGFAGLHPQALRHAVVVDMGPEIDRAGALNVRGSTSAQVRLPSGFRDEEEALSFLAQLRPGRRQESYRRTVTYGLKRGDDGLLHFRYDPTLLEITGRKALAEIPYLWGLLSKTTCPTLVVRGETSDILSRGIADRMVKALPKGKLVEIAGAGHDIPGDKPEDFEAAVLSFLHA